MVVSWRRRCPALAVAAPLWLSGCGATVYPPPDVAAPSQVGVLDHGQHSSLILQIPDGMVRYSYGDWKWYALRQTGPAEGIAALFWPTQAGLGRKQLPGPFSPMAVSREVRVGIENARLFHGGRAGGPSLGGQSGADLRGEQRRARSTTTRTTSCSCRIRSRIDVPQLQPGGRGAGSSSWAAGSKERRCCPCGSWAPTDQWFVPRRVSITPPGDGRRGRSAPRPRRRSSKDRGLSED